MLALIKQLYYQQLADPHVSDVVRLLVIMLVLVLVGFVIRACFSPFLQTRNAIIMPMVIGENETKKGAFYIKLIYLYWYFFVFDGFFRSLW